MVSCQSVKTSDLNRGDRLEVSSVNGFTYQIEMANQGSDGFFIQGGKRFKERTLVSRVEAEIGQGEHGAAVFDHIEVGWGLAVHHQGAPEGKHTQIPKILDIKLFRV